MAVAKPAPLKKAKVIESKTLTREALMAAINKRYKREIMKTAGHPDYEIERIPTGILSVDCLTGGGFARNRHTEIFGSAHVGKCMASTERMVLADGSVVAASSLVGRSFQVIGWDEETGSQRVCDAWAVDNGVREVWELTTTTGKKILRTGNHPLWTLRLPAQTCQRCGEPTKRRARFCSTSCATFAQWQATAIPTGSRGAKPTGPVARRPEQGWAELQNIQQDDRILVPVSHLAQGNQSVPQTWPELAGFLIGDGGMTAPGSVTFTQVDGAQLDRFQDIVQELGCKLNQASDFITYRVVGDTGVNNVLNLTRSWGIRHHARDKRIPTFVWTLPNQQMALFLNRYFSCDGWASVMNSKVQANFGQIGVCSASEGLIRDVGLALGRFGVFGAITSKKTNGVEYWTWHTQNAQSMRNFSSKIGILGKDEALDSAVCAAMDSEAHRTSEWNPPTNYRWGRIRSIKKIGVRSTVAISVPETKTYLTDFVEHNTFITLCLIANAQALGLQCAFVNVEGSFDPDFAAHIGVDLEALDMIPHDHANQAVDLIEAFLRSGLYDVIVMDSIAALLPKSELESDMEAASMGMEQAKLMSKALRKLTAANKTTALVFINQTRQAVGASAFAKQTITSGGRAMGFYAGQRIELTRIETMKIPGKVINHNTGDHDNKNVPIGHRVLVRIEKDKSGGSKPLEETSFIYDYRLNGVDRIADLILQGRTYGLISKKGSGVSERWSVVGYEDEEVAGRSRFKEWLKKNVAVAEELDEEIREAAMQKFSS